MTKSFIARLRVRPEAAAEFERLQAELKALVHAHEPDALVYEVLRSADDPTLYHVVATFRDEAAFDHHMSIDFHDRLVPPILACLAQDMELSFHTSLGEPAR
ncbi:MAG: putative quinol monooxygenase [Sphingomonadaceae bacterium]